MFFEIAPVPAGQVGKDLAEVAHQAERLAAFRSPGKDFGPRRHFLLHLLIKTTKKFAGAPLIDHFIGKCRGETRFTGKAFVPADFLSVVRPQEKGDLLLRKSQALALGQQIVGELW